MSRQLLAKYSVWMVVAASLLMASTAWAEVNDVAVALQVAREYRLTPFQTRVLLAVRVVENGREGREYGVLHPQAKGRHQVTQARWAAGSIKKRVQSERDLEAFARRWAPVGAANDPRGLNRHWLGNVRRVLGQLE